MNAVLEVLDGKRRETPPIWLMRQAGRYLPEYRALRETRKSFLDLCFDPKLACEITLQPIKRFGFDAAILFSDILVVPHALSRQVRFEEGEGPKLEPLSVPAAIDTLPDRLDAAVLAPVYETVRLVRKELPEDVAFLGFCGAPWTVATYMIAGKGTADQAPARLFAYRHAQAFEKLIAILTRVSADYLVGQFEAGVDAVQLFDTWGGILPPEEFARWCIAPCRQIVAEVRRRVPKAKFIGFPRGASTKLVRYAEEVPVDAIGLDWMIDLEFARGEIQRRKPVQGNLDPLVLLAGGGALDRSVDQILARLGAGPLIFNLGHGVLPETPLAHVERLLARVRR
jgi:uroporphyrinogen decarboxylase